MALVPFSAIVPKPCSVADYEKFASISGFNEDQIHFTSFAVKTVQLNHQSSGISCVAKILPHYACNNLLYIGFDCDNASTFLKIPNIGGNREARCKCVLKFEVDKSYFTILRTSIERISSDVLQKLLVHCVEPEWDYGKNKVGFLDDSQCEAMVKMVVSSFLSPLLVTGPSGTGKSYLVSNACQIITEKCQGSGETARILVSYHHLASAHSLMIEQFERLMFNFVNSLVFFVSDSFQDQRPNFVSEHEFEKHINKYIQMKQIVIVTTNLSASRISNHVPANFFTHIILEEASQSMEPEAVTPLCMADTTTSIILVGDPIQVSWLVLF